MRFLPLWQVSIFLRLLIVAGVLSRCPAGMPLSGLLVQPEGLATTSGVELSFRVFVLSTLRRPRVAVSPNIFSTVLAEPPGLFRGCRGSLKGVLSDARPLGCYVPQVVLLRHYLSLVGLLRLLPLPWFPLVSFHTLRNMP